MELDNGGLYLTVYSYYINDDMCSEGYIHNIYKRSVCFKDIFNENFNRLNTLKINIKISRKFNKGYNHYYIFKDSEAYQWLNYLAILFDTQLLIDFKSEDVYISLMYKGTRNKLKILLTCIRFLWESPYNVALKETLLLYNKGYFSNISLIYLYNVVKRTISSSFDTGHGLTVEGNNIKTEKVFKKTIDKYNGSVNGFFGVTFKNLEVIQCTYRNNNYITTIKDDFSEVIIMNQKFEPLSFEERLEIYKNNVKVFYGKEY